MRVLIVIFAVAWSAVFSTKLTFATVITADTIGADNFTTPNFYGVQFQSGSGLTSIQSVSWNISSIPNAFFDFDGSGSFGDATLPVIGTTVGLITGDVNFTFIGAVGGNSQHPNILRANFAPGSFGVNDSFRFGADTDFFFSDPAPGSVFGNGGGVLSVVLEGGQVGSANFLVVNSQQSIATISIGGQPVPEPTSFLIFAAGCTACAFVTRFRK